MNYGEYNEFEKSGLNENSIKELIDNRELYFNHKADKTDLNKYSSNIKLKKIDDIILPEYLINNKSKFSDWFD